jgi:hypothetical protein
MFLAVAETQFPVLRPNRQTPEDVIIANEKLLLWIPNN